MKELETATKIAILFPSTQLKRVVFTDMQWILLSGTFLLDIKECIKVNMRACELDIYPNFMIFNH